MRTASMTHKLSNRIVEKLNKNHNSIVVKN